MFYFGDQFDESKEKAEICEEESGGQKCWVSERDHVSLEVGRCVSRISYQVGRSVSRGEAQQRPTYQSSDPMDTSK